ncbi:hypothetical protein Leryth_001537 [Lithospermum erythrorhizon]|nr:hypothetical protein Leryth_001537 [Lithospermum erythrorhizon]
MNKSSMEESKNTAKTSLNTNPCPTSSNYQCIQCGFLINTLYIQYSPGNIRLMKCGNCKVVADEYIECEIMILIIDLILHKPKAYRHLFFNMFPRDALYFKGILWKLALAYLCLDAYRIHVLTANGNKPSSPATLNSPARTFAKIIMDVIFGNLACFGALLTGAKKILNSSTGNLEYKDILLAALVSSYFKMFLVTMMVWDFPTSVVFIIDIFVLSSNIVALQVISEAAISRCAGLALIASTLKFLFSCGLGNSFPLSLISSYS